MRLDSGPLPHTDLLHGQKLRRSQGASIVNYENGMLFWRDKLKCSISMVNKDNIPDFQ